MRKRTSTEQSYEPLVTPESWKGDELRFSVRLTQILDGLFARLRAMRTELAGKLGRTEQAADSAKLGGTDADSYALKTDTAPNAEKLGDKPPEYYLTPVNLLVNSDFKNPVNTSGKTSTTEYGVCIDNWIFGPSGGTASYSLDSNGITIANITSTYCEIVQKVEAYKQHIGKKMTFAVQTANHGLVVLNYTAGTNAWKFFDSNRFCLIHYDNGETLYIRSEAGNTTPITLQWVALYEGTYTAETLPPYVPSHKRVESLKIGLPVQPVNLLDNSWFGGRFVNGVKDGLVCQAGLNGLHGTNKYPMDRWISWNQDAGFADGYITVYSPYDQRLDPNKIDANKVYTVAACFADGTIVCSSGTASSNIGGYDNIGLYLNYNNGAPYVRMWHNGADNYRWVALYEGAYTAETLPPYVQKGYAVELAECQRYAHVIGADKWLLGSQVFGAGVMVPITISTAMRATPSAIGAWQAFIANTGWVDLTFWSVTYNAQTGFVHGIVFAGLEEQGVNAGDTVIVKGIDGLYCDP